MHSVHCGRVLPAVTRTRKRAHRLGIVTAAALLAASAGAGSAGAATSVAGGAYGINANGNALVAPVSVGALPSVTLPPEGGGPFTESLLSANLAGLVPAQIAKVSSEGNAGVGSARSSATVVDVGVSGLVTASAARSRCSATAGSADGSASVVDLVVAGIPISTVNAGPNTSIAVPVGSVIINEQRRTGASQITVNAVHVVLEAAVVSADIVIAQSRCAVKSSTRAAAKKVRRRSARA
jgi:hypothetical protein